MNVNVPVWSVRIDSNWTLIAAATKEQAGLLAAGTFHQRGIAVGWISVNPAGPQHLKLAQTYADEGDPNAALILRLLGQPAPEPELVDEPVDEPTLFETGQV